MPVPPLHLVHAETSLVQPMTMRTAMATQLWRPSRVVRRRLLRVALHRLARRRHLPAAPPVARMQLHPRHLRPA